jgi:uncharacterized protein
MRQKGTNGAIIPTGKKTDRNMSIMGVYIKKTFNGKITKSISLKLYSMKNQFNTHLETVILAVTVAAGLLLFSMSEVFAQKEKSEDADHSFSSCQWHFSGHVGNYIDKISEQRILNEDNWNIIYPETEEAFRLREDDKNYPQNGQWRGEFWGKYILSVIAARHYYHSDELESRIKKAVEGLLSTQDENGYIGTYEHSDFVIGNNWNVWSRKYTLWGLVEAWELLQDKTILEAAERFTDHLISEVGPGAIDIVKTGNFYGMPSSSILQPVVKLYNATGKKKYLEYAEYIVEQWSRHPEGLPEILDKGLEGIPVHAWSSEIDPLRWAKGYEFMSCVEGLLELYEATGNPDYFEAGKNIHKSLVEWERSPIGNVTFDDKHTGSVGCINTVSEICDAVYWNRLSFKLFELTGEVKYIAEIEKTLYNSLLSAYNQEGTWGLRRMRMSHIHIPAMNHFLQHHQCCTDNLPRGLFQAAEVVLTQRNGNIHYSLFNEGRGEVILPSGQPLQIEVMGDFLESGKTKLVLSLDEPEKFNMVIRMPHWSKKTEVSVNGKKLKGAIDGNWRLIDRTWKEGDVIEVAFNLEVRWENFDTSKYDNTFHDLDFYNNEWAKISFGKGGSNEDITRQYSHIKSLSAEDALPHKPAVTFFYGPVALARDVRITDGDIFMPVEFSNGGKPIKIKSIKGVPGIWKAYELNLGKGQRIKFCDFSSAGNTWDDSSKFNTWCTLKK